MADALGDAHRRLTPATEVMTERVMRRLHPNTPGRSTAALLFACARRTTAQKTYGGAVGSLIKYCTAKQLAAGLPPLSYFPASQATIIG